MQWHYYSSIKYYSKKINQPHHIYFDVIHSLFFSLLLQFDLKEIGDSSFIDDVIKSKLDSVSGIICDLLILLLTRLFSACSWKDTVWCRSRRFATSLHPRPTKSPRLLLACSSFCSLMATHHAKLSKLNTYLLWGTFCLILSKGILCTLWWHPCYCIIFKLQMWIQ